MPCVPSCMAAGVMGDPGGAVASVNHGGHGQPFGSFSKSSTVVQGSGAHVLPSPTFPGLHTHCLPAAVSVHAAFASQSELPEHPAGAAPPELAVDAPPLPVECPPAPVGPAPPWPPLAPDGSA